MTGEEDAYVLERYQAGDSQVNIATALGRSQGAVWCALRRLGIKARTRAEIQARSIDIGFVHRALLAGKSYTVIAGLCGVSRDTLIRRARAAGLPPSIAIRAQHVDA